MGARTLPVGRGNLTEQLQETHYFLFRAADLSRRVYHGSREGALRAIDRKSDPALEDAEMRTVTDGAMMAVKVLEASGEPTTVAAAKLVRSKVAGSMGVALRRAVRRGSASFRGVPLRGHRLLASGVLGLALVAYRHIGRPTGRGLRPHGRTDPQARLGIEASAAMQGYSTARS